MSTESEKFAEVVRVIERKRAELQMAGFEPKGIILPTSSAKAVESFFRMPFEMSGGTLLGLLVSISKESKEIMVAI